MPWQRQDIWHPHVSGSVPTCNVVTACVMQLLTKKKTCYVFVNKLFSLQERDESLDYTFHLLTCEIREIGLFCLTSTLLPPFWTGHMIPSFNILEVSTCKETLNKYLQWLCKSRLAFVFRRTVGNPFGLVAEFEIISSVFDITSFFPMSYLIDGCLFLA